MLVAAAYVLNTAPLEGFDPAGAKRAFGVPDEAEGVALLALGRARPPDKAFFGRFSLNRLVLRARYGAP